MRIFKYVHSKSEENRNSNAFFHRTVILCLQIKCLKNETLFYNKQIFAVDRKKFDYSELRHDKLTHSQQI